MFFTGAALTSLCLVAHSAGQTLRASRSRADEKRGLRMVGVALIGWAVAFTLFAAGFVESA